MLKVWDADNFRRTLAGLCLIAAPLALAASEGGYALVAVESPDQQHAAIAETPGIWMGATFVGFLAAILFVPAVLGVIHLLKGRGVVLGHIGGALAIVGMLGYAAHQSLFVLMGEMALMEDQREAVIEISNRLDDSVAIGVMVMLMFLLSFFVGMLLLTIGAYRGGIAPFWTPVFVFLSILPDFLPYTSEFLDYAGFGLLFIGLGMIGLKVLRMSDADWERGGVTVTVEKMSRGAQPLTH